MPIDPATALGLSMACAPGVDPQTLLAVVKVESGFEPLAIGVNGRPAKSLRPATREEAVGVASRRIAAGENLDLGLGQINSSQLPRLGLSLQDVFDPCANLAVSARILVEGYNRSRRLGVHERRAVHEALSLYNTGDRERGFRNGYVAKVVRAAGRLTPVGKDAIGSVMASRGDPPAPPEPPLWDAFANARMRPAAFVFSPNAGSLP